MLFYNFKRVINLDFTEKLYHIEAIAWLLFAKTIVLVFPVRRIYKYLGEMNGNVSLQLSNIDSYRADLVKISILRSGRYVPWKSVCLDQAIAAGVMLRFRNIPYRLCLGIKTDNAARKLAAHAWIECGKRILIGGRESLSFKIILSFGNDKRKTH